MTFEIGSIAAWVAAGVSVFAALVARRSSGTAASAYQLNAAKEWADRVASIDQEYQLIGYLKRDLDASIRPYFAKSGALNSSAHTALEAEISQLVGEADQLHAQYPFGAETKRVLSATTAIAFASLVAELERNRAKICAYRMRLETLRGRVQPM